MTHMDAYAVPTNDIDYRCHIKAIEHGYWTNHMGSISHHIMTLVINSLGSGHTHTQHTHTDVCRQGNFKKQGACQSVAGACLA